MTAGDAAPSLPPSRPSHLAGASRFPMPFPPACGCASMAAWRSACRTASADRPASPPVSRRERRSGLEPGRARGVALDPRAHLEQLDLESLKHVAGVPDAHALDD